MNSTPRAPILQLVVVLICAFMVNCGGGASSSSDSSDTGRVAILLTDNPIKGIVEVNISLSKIELLGEGPPVVLYEDEKTVDLLDLKNFTDLFAVSDSVPTGVYTKIRLRVTGVELRDEEGETHTADLPANGKIDLNPREDFPVVSGETLVVEVDIDAGKSIHVVHTGSGKYKFRPVVFVRVVSTAGDEKLARISGIVRDAPEGSELVLCATVDPDTGCITVELREDTGIFDPNGDQTSADIISAGDQITAIGNFDTSVKGDGETGGTTLEKGALASRHVDDMLHFVAFVIEMGGPGTFAMLDGEVATEPSDAAASFDFSIAPGQGFADGSVVTVLPQAGTRIYSTSGHPLEYDSLVTGVIATIDGVLSLSDTEPDTLKSSLIVIDDSDEVMTIEGTIASIDPLLVSTGGGDQCIELADGVEVLGLSASESEAADASDLEAGQSVELFGVEGSECFIASTVLVLE